MKVIKYILFLFLAGMTAGTVAQADAFTTLPAFNAQDRVLVLAPHPDDEAIGAGGAIQQALAAGATVNVVLMTYGENNELSFLVYKKRPVLLPKALLAMGEMRLGESLTSSQILGLTTNDVIPLGYPDFGTMDIFTRYWGPVRKPFRGMLSRRRHVPYESARSLGAPYVGESLLGELTDIIREFRPTKIFVSHPVDTNRDHRAMYLFTTVALWDLQGTIDPPLVFPYLIHALGWPRPRGFHPQLPLSVPDLLLSSDISWFTLPLTPEQVVVKQKAIAQYVTQIKYAPKYLCTFARANELFGDYPVVSLKRQMASVPEWQMVSAGFAAAQPRKFLQGEEISYFGYARQGNNLLIKVRLSTAVDDKYNVALFLLGYRKDVPFAQMPKLQLIIKADSFHIKDRWKNVSSKEIILLRNDKELIFTVPLSLLGGPERILSSAKTSVYDMAKDETAWRVLYLP